MFFPKKMIVYIIFWRCCFNCAVVQSVHLKATIWIKLVFSWWGLSSLSLYIHTWKVLLFKVKEEKYLTIPMLVSTKYASLYYLFYVFGDRYPVIEPLGSYVWILSTNAFVSWGASTVFLSISQCTTWELDENLECPMNDNISRANQDRVIYRGR